MTRRLSAGCPKLVAARRSSAPGSSSPARGEVRRSAASACPLTEQGSGSAHTHTQQHSPSTQRAVTLRVRVTREGQLLIKGERAAASRQRLLRAARGCCVLRATTPVAFPPLLPSFLARGGIVWGNRCVTKHSVLKQ